MYIDIEINGRFFCRTNKVGESRDNLIYNIANDSNRELIKIESMGHTVNLIMGPQKSAEQHLNILEKNDRITNNSRLFYINDADFDKNLTKDNKHLYLIETEDEEFFIC